MISGKIKRISGPIVYASGLEGCGLYELVDVGKKKLIGEIISQEKGMATIEVCFLKCINYFKKGL